MPSLAAFGLGLALAFATAVPAALLLIRRAERRTRRSERRARESEHLAHLGSLTAGLAHELRNPLSTLNLNLQLLKEDLDRPGRPADARLLRKLDTIEQEAKRLEEILNDFLKLAGKHDVKLKVQPINPALEEAVAFYRERLERSGVTVRTSFADALPPVALDASLMNQALLNLILNAEAAMPEGGELMIRTEPVKRGVRIHVTDTGVGIPPEVLDKIFRPYYSTRKGGTGLGLSTVRRIVREHDGTLEVHSEPGRGTRFTVDLPAARAEPGADASDPAAEVLSGAENDE